MNQDEFDFINGFPRIPHPLLADFQRFHKLRPDVYDIMVDLARTMVAIGRRRIGIKHLYEICRWQLNCGELSNNHHAFYARLIMEQEPDLAGVFEIREQRN